MCWLDMNTQNESDGKASSYLEKQPWFPDFGLSIATASNARSYSTYGMLGSRPFGSDYI